MPIINHSIHESSHVWSPYGKIMFGIACIALGWILACTYAHGLDAFRCPLWPGQDMQSYFNGGEQL